MPRSASPGAGNPRVVHLRWPGNPWLACGRTYRPNQHSTAELRWGGVPPASRCPDCVRKLEAPAQAIAGGSSAHAERATVRTDPRQLDLFGAGPGTRGAVRSSMRAYAATLISQRKQSPAIAERSKSPAIAERSTDVDPTAARAAGPSPVGGGRGRSPRKHETE